MSGENETPIGNENDEVELTEAEMFAQLMGEAGDATAAPPALDPEPETPEQTPAATETPTPAASSVAQPDETVPSWVQALPEDAQTAWKNLVETNQRLSTDFSRERQARMAVEGRLAPIQRKLSALESGRDLPRQPAPATQAPTGNAQTQLDSYYDSPSWKKFEADFPEEAATQRQAMEWNARQSDERIRRLEERILGQNQQTDPRLEVLTQHVEKVELNNQIEALAKEHPDWAEINASQEFVNWLNDYRLNQPEEVKSIYMDEAKFNKLCRDAKFASNLLTNYKRDAYIAEVYLSQQTPAPANTTTTPVTETPAPRQQPAATAGSRLLALTATPDVRGGPVARPVDTSQLSEAEQFNLAFYGTTNPPN